MPALKGTPVAAAIGLVGGLALLHLANVAAQPSAAVSPLENAMWSGAKVHDLIEGGQWHRLVVASLHHADTTHLSVNLAMIGVMALLCGALLGGGAAAGICLSGGIFATVVSDWLNPAAWSLGESGGGYALTGAVVTALAARSGRREHRRLGLLGVVIALLGAQIASADAHVDRIAHAAGLIWGMCVGYGLAVAEMTGRSERRAFRAIAALVLLLLGGAVGWAESAHHALLNSVRQTGTALRRDVHGAGCDWVVPPGWVERSSPVLADGGQPGTCITNGLADVCVLVPSSLERVEATWFGEARCQNDEAEEAPAGGSGAWWLVRRSNHARSEEPNRSMWARDLPSVVFAEAHLPAYEINPDAVPSLHRLRRSMTCQATARTDLR